jgi:cytochrome c peroxidase
MLGKSNRTSDFMRLAEKQLRRVRRLPYNFLVVGLAMTTGGMAQLGGQPGGACAGQTCGTAASGLRAFLDRDLHALGGNGRACADCHMPLNSFQLSPGNAEARFQLLQFRRRSDAKADDPLFRAIDADDFRINGANASDFTTLRKHALIRIVFPLPSAMKLIDPQTNQPSVETFVDVWRAVPTVNDVALTGPDGQNPSARGPNPAGGYQYDARFGTLQQQALAALVSHAEIRTAPTQPLLDALAAFQLTLFTNPRVRAVAEAVREGTTPVPDPDPPLNELELAGKAVFSRACAHCHGGPGQSTTFRPVVFRYHDILTTCPRPVDSVGPPRFAFAACPDGIASKARTYEITLPSGATVRRRSSDPGRALLTGFVGGPPASDDWNKLDVPGLRGISQTAPYFHNNSAATLEDVVDHYIQFFKFVQANQPPGVVPPVASTDGVNFDRQPRLDERAALLAYLRKL